ncbi:MAG: gliding motility-associated C-terminal domain-containing protein, partial [Flavobacteriales bacterium]
YNRWGNIIFEATSYSNNWSGKDCPDGVYFFILKRSDGETFEGHVQILRD